MNALTTVLLSALVVSAVRGQCPTPDATFALPGIPGTETAMAAFDAGDGAKLYASHYAGGPARIQRWTGTRWEIVFERLVAGSPPFSTIGVLHAGHEGATPVLLTAVRSWLSSNPNEVWRWDGVTWTQLGSLPASHDVWDLEYLDDGTGVALTAAVRNAGWASGSVWRWDGVQWNQVGSDLPKALNCVVSLDSGAGAQLYAFGGNGLQTGIAAVWNGSSWSQLPDPLKPVAAASVYDSGSGPQLYIGIESNFSAGFFNWNGSAWDVMGGSSASVAALEVVDWGSGPVLAIAGLRRFSQSANLYGIVFFDGTSFSATGPTNENFSHRLERLAFVDEGATKRLFVSGTIDIQGGVRNEGLVAWDGASFSTLGRGIIDDPLSSTEDGSVHALAGFDFGVGTELVAGGSFRAAGYSTSESNGVARWSAGDWSGLGSGPGIDAYCLANVALPTGTTLFVGGGHPSAGPSMGVKSWNGTQWTQPISSTWGDVYAMTSFGSGASTRLVAGGNFVVANSVPASRVAQFDGLSWTALGAGTNDIVAALCEYDPGSGSTLIAAGSFTLADGLPASRIASWNGSSWSALAGGLNGGANAVCVFDDGSGARLYAGGTFSDAGGTSVSNLARWNGSSWSDVPGGGSDGGVLAMIVHDDGRGPALYVAGGFSTIGGIPAANIARFDGAQWESLSSGTDNAVLALASLDDDGDGDADLFLGGRFLEAFGVSSGRIARWPGCPHYTSFCFGDGTLADHTTPCPCGNSGAPGHGCANSFVAAGALLEAHGSTFADDLVLTASGEPQSSFGIFLQHDAPDDRVFHDGTLCANGVMIRLRQRFAVGGVSEFPNSTDTITLSQRGQVVPGSGATRYYSLFYRNASTTFCAPALANVTNGVRVVW